MTEFARATAILKDNRDILERAAAELLAKETLDEVRLRELTSGLRGTAAPSAALAGPRST